MQMSLRRALLVILSLSTFREVFFSDKHTKCVKFYAGLTNLTRREKFLAECFVVVGSRNLSALIIDVRTHPLNAVLGLLLSERLERYRKKRKIIEKLIQGGAKNRPTIVNAKAPRDSTSYALPIEIYASRRNNITNGKNYLVEFSLRNIRTFASFSERLEGIDDFLAGTNIFRLTADHE